MERKKFIDVEKVIREKSPSLYKWLPKFIIKWLKKKLHEDEINAAMSRHEHEFGLDYNDAALYEFGVKVKAHGFENIPKTGRIIIAANHPLGGLDGIALIKAVGDVRPDVRFIVNDVLRNLKNFGDIFVGVNKVGNNTRNALNTIEEVYGSESAVLVFPAGLVSRKQKGEIKDLEWNKSFISKAIKYKTFVLPTYIEGTNSRFFYNFSLWRKRFGIKGNLEMLFLPDEMFKQKGKTIKIYFGNPISYELFDKQKTQAQWAQAVKAYIYSNDFRQGRSFEEFLNYYQIR